MARTDWDNSLRDINWNIINPGTEETLQSIAGFNIPPFDYILAWYPLADTETFTYKDWGAGWTTVAVITVVYTDATKTVLTSVTKS